MLVLRGGCAVLLCLLASAVAQDNLFMQYGRQKVMTKCFGEDLYFGRLAILESKKAECLLEPIYIPAFRQTPSTFPNVVTPGFPRPHVGYNYPTPPAFPTHILTTPGFQGQVHGKARSTRQARNQVLVDRGTMLALAERAQASLSNYTCLMRKLNVVDDNLNLRIDNIQRDYYQVPLNEDLRQDMLEGIDYCYQLSRCLPVDRIDWPIPQQLKRLVFFGKCEQEQRFARCFKHDIRTSLFHFDLSAIPDTTTEGRVHKVTAIFVIPDLLEQLSGF